MTTAAKVPRSAKIAAAGLAVAKRSDKVDDYPNPDLAIEIDISPSKIDRPGIYAALTVSEFSGIHDDKVSIEKLTSKGTYTPIASSRLLRVRSEDVTKWIFKEESKSRLVWKERLRKWLRAEFRSNLLTIICLMPTRTSAQCQLPMIPSRWQSSKIGLARRSSTTRLRF